jgi:radical SAM-linked protein
MTTATKVRLRFAKRGDLRLVSHHDLLRCLERMLRRARVPMAVTGGFNPRPRITFALALGLGIEAWNEVVDLELSEAWEPSDLLIRLRAAAPLGFDWLDARPLPPQADPPRPRSVEYHVPITADRRADAQAALDGLLRSTSWPVVRRRPDREYTFDLRPHLVAAALSDDGFLRFRLQVAPDGSARPEDLLEALRLRDLLDSGTLLTRTDVELPNSPDDPAP